MLMECTDENVPIDEEKAASKNVHAGQRTTGMMPFFFSTLTICEALSSTAGHTLVPDSFTVEEPHQNPVFHHLHPCVAKNIIHEICIVGENEL